MPLTRRTVGQVQSSISHLQSPERKTFGATVGWGRAYWPESPRHDATCISRGCRVSGPALPLHVLDRPLPRIHSTGAYDSGSERARWQTWLLCSVVVRPLQRACRCNVQKSFMAASWHNSKHQVSPLSKSRILLYIAYLRNSRSRIKNTTTLCFSSQLPLPVTDHGVEQKPPISCRAAPPPLPATPTGPLFFLFFSFFFFLFPSIFSFFFSGLSPRPCACFLLGDRASIMRRSGSWLLRFF